MKCMFANYRNYIGPYSLLKKINKKIKQAYTITQLQTKLHNFLIFNFLSGNHQLPLNFAKFASDKENFMPHKGKKEEKDTMQFTYAIWLITL